MFQNKAKFKLSKNLKLAIDAPSSQGIFFKVSGVFFLLLSLVLIWNIAKNLNSQASSAANSQAAAIQPKVLGAFDEQNAASSPITATYTVQKGDTLFNIAQKYNVNWVVIASLNDLHAPYTLKLGTVLKLR